ncbi:MAG: dihydrodipicolinate synthase family protein [SAR202 cluster bacterium]|nr:dihydrodipicolinate synthase family protein [SAR202 cluster bacterium]|tara:strand:+ start:2085 stop:3005 length:921 start_codon:yes stop_codon:yes gene_type:complete
MKNHEYKGVIVPIITPFTLDEKIDVKSLKNLVNYLVDAGVHGIWAAGTSGEFSALSDLERLKVMETVAEEVNGRIPIIGNISATSTKLAIKLAKDSSNIGIDGLAVTPPYYYDSSQSELIDHFVQIKNQTSLPLWVYNIPSTVKTTVEPSTIATLAKDSIVVGIKDSSGTGEKLAELTFMCKRDEIDLKIFLGSVYRIPYAQKLDAHGIIPGDANLLPSYVVKAWEYGLINSNIESNTYMKKIDEARKIQNLSKSGADISSKLAGIKSGLKEIGIIECDIMSSPLKSLTEEEKQPIKNILKSSGLL